MPFEMRSSVHGGTAVSAEHVTTDDGLALLEIVGDNPTWRYLVVDVSPVANRRTIDREEELQHIHRLARIIRDLTLPSGFRIAVVTSSVSHPPAADFVDLCRFIVPDIDIALFETAAAAEAWATTIVSTD